MPLVGPAEASRYTVDHYRRDLEKFAAWWKASERDDQLSPGAILESDLRDWRDHLRAEEIDQGTPRERTRKAAAVNAVLSAIKSFMAWCETAGILANLPAMPKRVKSARPVYKAVPLIDQKRFRWAVERKGKKRDMALLLVLLDGGLRVAERAPSGGATSSFRSGKPV